MARDVQRELREAARSAEAPGAASRRCASGGWRPCRPPAARSEPGRRPRPASRSRGPTCSTPACSTPPARRCCQRRYVSYPPTSTIRKIIGFGNTTASAIIPRSRRTTSTAPSPPSRGRRRAATTGSRLKRFRKNPVNASARQKSLPVACQIRISAAAPMLPRIGPARPDAGFGERVVAERSGADHRAQERDEHRRAGLDPLAPQRDHVAHLVDRSSSTTNPAANGQPEDRRCRRRPRPASSPTVVSSFIFGSSSRTP